MKPTKKNMEARKERRTEDDRGCSRGEEKESKRRNGSGKGDERLKSAKEKEAKEGSEEERRDRGRETRG